MRFPSGRRLVSLFFLATALLSASAGAQTLKLLDWNTHHGVGTDGKYDLQRFVTWIARSGAQVVTLNEVERFTGWGNEDQPARYAALLTAATGKTWYYTFAEREGRTKGQGNLILSTLPIEASGATTLSYSRSAARAQLNVEGVAVNVFSTHLDADSAARRTTQMAELKAWTSGFAQQHIIAGDFNAWPGGTEITNMAAFSRDAWAVAKAAGTTVAYAGNEAGNTRTSRIDYIWYSKSASRLTVKAAQVFDVRDGGVMPSDHRPVMATFQIGAGSSRASGPPPVDFDGDRKSDLSLYRSSTGDWFSMASGARVTQVRWGVPSLGDIPAPGDYDGDGRADAAVFRPADATWYVRYSRTGGSFAARWGLPGDIPVAGDYDGDDKTDAAVFRPSEGVWYVRFAASGATTAVRWGLATDIPVPGDYDGDGKTDAAVFRPADGTWYVWNSASRTAFAFAWGTAGDRPVAGDYDGDGRTDLAVFRPATGVWYVRFSSTGQAAAVQWGIGADRIVAADYDGDGRTDLAVFRPSQCVWYFRYSSTGATAAIVFGDSADLPMPGR
jgi:endonuclease/exonuclease/phosphatase family metal-dependent hydrolase